MNQPTAADIVIYDRVSSSREAYPYRSESLYRADANASMRIGRGKPVQIIREHGASLWSEATLLSYEPVGDMGGVRFRVMLPEGTEHMVSEDRIRPAR